MNLLKLKDELNKIINSKNKNSKLNELINSLYRFSILDGKTQVFNFNFFNEIFEIEIEKAKRKKQTLSLILIDIDNFKIINEIYGYLEGDNLLKRLAKILKTNIRKTDLLARFGGDEFVILTSFTKAKKAEQIVERIKEKIRFDGILRKYEISISAGIAEYRKDDTKEKLFEKANKALNKAKKRRDSTEIYNGD